MTGMALYAVGVREPIDPSQQVVRRDPLIEAKLVKELPLISVLPPHHRRLSCRLLSRKHCSLGSSSPFSTASVKLRNTQHEQMSSALPPILLQKSKVASVRIFGETLKREAIDDSYNLSRFTEVAYEFSVRR